MFDQACAYVFSIKPYREIYEANSLDFMASITSTWLRKHNLRNGILYYINHECIATMKHATFLVYIYHIIYLRYFTKNIEPHVSKGSAEKMRRDVWMIYEHWKYWNVTHEVLRGLSSRTFASGIFIKCFKFNISRASL